MKLAAAKALADLAREDVPDQVIRAYGGKSIKFGRDYLIPKPFDHRVLLWEAPAVADAAISSGIARKPYESREEYVRELESRLSRIYEVMHVVFDHAKLDPKRIVFPEGEAPRIVRAAKILAEEGVCRPILLGNFEVIADLLQEHEVPNEAVDVVDPMADERSGDYASTLFEMRWRQGVTELGATKLMRDPVYFGNMMVQAKDADGLIAGLTHSYPETIRPALQIHKTLPGVHKAAGVYLLLFEDRMLFIADTTVNQDPTAQELAEIAGMASRVARIYFEVEPRVAMLSYSNFGSNTDGRSQKVREAVAIAKERWPQLVIEGEMQADTAVEPALARENFPLSKIHGDANILVCPDLESANIAYKLLWRLGKVEAIGPILTGIGAPVHVLQRGVGVDDIVNMAALCVRKAQRYG
jgi:malate dehydrogenase (oxaloacetate-decarboxylating)(NADP+)